MIRDQRLQKCLFLRLGSFLIVPDCSWLFLTVPDRSWHQLSGSWSILTVPDRWSIMTVKNHQNRKFQTSVVVYKNSFSFSVFLPLQDIFYYNYFYEFTGLCKWNLYFKLLRILKLMKFFVKNLIKKNTKDL